MVEIFVSQEAMNARNATLQSRQEHRRSYIREYMRKRRQVPGLPITPWRKIVTPEQKRAWHTAYTQKWRAEHPKEYKRQTHESYLRTRAKGKRPQDAWSAKNPEKTRAQRLAHYAVKVGHIDKGTCCDNCCSEENIVSHHPDYSLPLAVIWLCRKCHKAIHKGTLINHETGKIERFEPQAR